MSERCFVIQPFDNGGPFDKRYEDVLVPAINAAEAEAYRVDRDADVEIPIDRIETGISGSVVCLADITENNPNVWFELGYAIALTKPVVLICRESRELPFPFDVQHRAIIPYRNESPRDFGDLQGKVTERLQAILRQSSQVASIGALSPLSQTAGLAPQEAAVLVSLMNLGYVYQTGVLTVQIQEAPRGAGFNDTAAAIVLLTLERKDFVSQVRVPSEYEGSDYPGYRLEQKGVEWLVSNQRTLNLRVAPPLLLKAVRPNDDIPF